MNKEQTKKDYNYYARKLTEAIHKDLTGQINTDNMRFCDSLIDMDIDKAIQQFVKSSCEPIGYARIEENVNGNDRERIILITEHPAGFIHWQYLPNHIFGKWYSILGGGYYELRIGSIITQTVKDNMDKNSNIDGISIYCALRDAGILCPPPKIGDTVYIIYDKGEWSKVTEVVGIDTIKSRVAYVPDWQVMPITIETYTQLERMYKGYYIDVFPTYELAMMRISKYRRAGVSNFDSVILEGYNI